MLREPKGRKKMMERFKRLVSDGPPFNFIEHGYKLRDGYLHSLGDTKATISWKDLGQVRWSVTKAVDRYLDLAERSNLNREGLLLSLVD